MAARWHDVVALPHDHVVNFYDADADLVEAVSWFTAEGLRGDAPVLVIATRAHRDAIDATLLDDGIDVARAHLSGRYVCLDAAETLSRVTVGASPDPGRLRSIIEPLAAAAVDTDRPLRVFGEMVALLWDAGDVTGAIELERLWNVLARDYRFSLYCAYPISSLAAHDDLAATGHVCSQHSHVIPPVSYSSMATGPSVDDAFQRSQLFVPVAEAVRVARQFVATTLRAWSRDDLVSDAAIVASELATNAVLHANSPFRVSLQRRDACIEIAVHDVSPLLPRQLHPEPRHGGGRGLTLIDRLSTEWGVERSREGKVIWSQFDRSTS
jgi:anti-sigma regulatory factor (Ser/Thr protein kinase)